MFLKIGKFLFEIEQNHRTCLLYGAENYPHSRSVISTKLFMLNKVLYKGTTYKTVKYITCRPSKYMSWHFSSGNQKLQFFSDDKQWVLFHFNLQCILQIFCYLKITIQLVDAYMYTVSISLFIRIQSLAQFKEMLIIKCFLLIVSNGIGRPIHFCFSFSVNFYLYLAHAF